jgi:hypothetical protein
MSLLRFVLIIITLFVCVSPLPAYATTSIGITINYADSWPVIDWETDNTIAVGVHDQRPYVVNGEESPTYLGTIRGVLGISRGKVNTHSNKPLADDIASAITAGFKRLGTSAEPISILHSDNRQVVIDKLSNSGASRLVLITLWEWRSDNFDNPLLLYVEATATVYDLAGQELAKSRTSHRNLGFRYGELQPHKESCRRHLGRLLNDHRVRAALQSH